MRSGTRLGVVDMKGPELRSWNCIRSINEPMQNFPICTMIFDEAIDCLHSSLTAVVTASGKDDNMTIVANHYCTAMSQQLNIVVDTRNLNSIDDWKERNVTVAVAGVYDIFGNAFGENIMVQNNRRRFLQDKSNANKTVIPIILRTNFPDIPNSSKTTIARWELPTEEEMIRGMKEYKESLLPIGAGIPYEHIFKEVKDPNGGNVFKKTSVLCLMTTILLLNML